MSRGKLSSTRVLFASSFLVLVFSFLCATALGQEPTTPKADLFVGYQWLNPGGKVPAPGNPPNAPVAETPPSLPDGAGLSATYNFSKWWGLESDFGYNTEDKFGHELTISTGPRLMWRTDGANMFLHTMISFNRLKEYGFDASNGVGAILGGGMDLPITRSFAIRVFEADYVWAHHNFASAVDPGFPSLRRPSLNGARLRGGFVFSFGDVPVVPPTASCSVQPSTVMVGEPITATATVANANPKHTLTYAWSSTGGKVSGKDTTATIDTNGVAGGSYVVTAHVSDPKMKTGGETSCSANFTVKEPPKNPPTMSCSASPTSLQAGGTSNLTCTCTSPDNVPVTVSGWTASAGSVSGSGGTATLNTTGAPPGEITVSATCTDSRGLTAPASAQVTVEAPPPPPPPQASKLSSCDFSNMDKIKKPWRVDNECKAILDDVAKNLQQNADNKLVIVGNAEPTEKRKNLAAERAVNAKAYLSGGESKLGIDAGRIETRTGSAGTKTAEFWVLPLGATFPAEGTQAVDESKVKAVPDHPHVAPKKKMMPKTMAH